LLNAIIKCTTVYFINQPRDLGTGTDEKPTKRKYGLKKKVK